MIFAFFDFLLFLYFRRCCRCCRRRRRHRHRHRRLCIYPTSIEVMTKETRQFFGGNF